MRRRGNADHMQTHSRRCTTAACAAQIAVVLALTISVGAQGRPDLSGRWQISQAKSSAGATGNNATISFPSELVITQHPAELHVESRYPRSEPQKTVYKFDGSEITITLPSNVTERARASWDGDRLVISARRVVTSPFGEFVTDMKEVWRRAGNVLTVQKSQSSQGLTDSETAVFDRAQP